MERRDEWRGTWRRERETRRRNCSSRRGRENVEHEERAALASANLAEVNRSTKVSTRIRMDENRREARGGGTHLLSSNSNSSDLPSNPPHLLSNRWARPPTPPFSFSSASSPVSSLDLILRATRRSRPTWKPRGGRKRSGRIGRRRTET